MTEEAQGGKEDRMAKFRTRSKAAVPVRINLIDPETNENSGEWIEVVSSLSDQFRAARDESHQRMAEFVATNPDAKARKEFVKESMLKLYAALVVAWSFGTPVNESNVIDFLRDAPQVCDAVVNVADDGRRFFAKRLNS